MRERERERERERDRDRDRQTNRQKICERVEGKKTEKRLKYEHKCKEKE